MRLPVFVRLFSSFVLVGLKGKRGDKRSLKSPSQCDNLSPNKRGSSSKLSPLDIITFCQGHRSTFVHPAAEKWTCSAVIGYFQSSKGKEKRKEREKRVKNNKDKNRWFHYVCAVSPQGSLCIQRVENTRSKSLHRFWCKEGTTAVTVGAPPMTTAGCSNIRLRVEGSVERFTPILRLRYTPSNTMYV